MFLYFIEAGDAIKVGVASDVENRISNMQTGNAHKIKLLHSVDMTEIDACEMEKEIHDLFHRTNLRGEWFQSTQFMAEYIENIKENGIVSHLDWIKDKYKSTYGDIVKKIEAMLEIDTIQGNLMSFDMLKKDLGFLLLVKAVLPEPVKRNSMGDRIRDWAKYIAPGTAFTIKHIYRDLGINKRKDKHNAVVALARFVEGSKLVDKVGSNYYIIN